MTKNSVTILVALIGLVGAIAAAVIGAGYIKCDSGKASRNGDASSTESRPAMEKPDSLPKRPDTHRVEASDRDRGQPTDPSPEGGEPSDWPLVARDEFTNSQSAWFCGSHQDEYISKFERTIVAGKYRWSIDFLKKRTWWQPSPHGSLTDFYVAVDAAVTRQSGGGVDLGLTFGYTGSGKYEFILSEGRFYLSQWKGDDHIWVLPRTYVNVALENNNRIALLVDSGRMTFYINDNKVGTYRDLDFNGGAVGLFVSGAAGTSVVAEFDNFELRRRP